MSRTMDTERTSPVGVGQYWGEYDATTDFPNTAAGVSTNHLNRGDTASVAGELYVCTSAVPGSATWALLQRAASTTALTSGRVPYVTTGGALKDEAAFTYTEGSDLLTVGSVTCSGTVQAEQLTTTDDLTVTGLATVGETLAVTGATTLTGAATLTGGIAQAVAPSGFANWQPIAATSGTDTTPANDTQFVTSIFVPVNFTITNVNYLIGSVGGTDKVYAVIYDASGTNVAASDVTGGGATVGTAANIQTLALTSPYAAKGPAMYYVGISMNGNTARLRTVPAHCQAGLYAGSVTQTHGTVGAITEPVTFTADKAPVVFVN